eukprot:scaffold154100_cov19-Tisochrysis_lutea.AAC.1
MAPPSRDALQPVMTELFTCREPPEMKMAAPGAGASGGVSGQAGRRGVRGTTASGRGARARRRRCRAERARSPSTALDPRRVALSSLTSAKKAAMLPPCASAAKATLPMGASADTAAHPLIEPWRTSSLARGSTSTHPPAPSIALPSRRWTLSSVRTASGRRRRALERREAWMVAPAPVERRERWKPLGTSICSPRNSKMAPSASRREREASLREREAERAERRLRASQRKPLG